VYRIVYIYAFLDLRCRVQRDLISTANAEVALAGPAL